MATVLLEPAYVLHSRTYRESSLLLEVLSQNHGRVALVARGCRRPKSRLKGMLQPFRPLLISWKQKGEMGTLTAADQVAAPPLLRDTALYCGLYLNELLMRLLHRHDVHPTIFDDYRQVLAHLIAGEGIQQSLRLFEKHVLEAVGFALILDREYPDGEPIDPGAWYMYQPESGPVRHGPPKEKNHQLISGQSLLAFHQEQLDQANSRQTRQLTRQVIRYHLGGKSLKSYSLIDSESTKP